MKKYDVIITGAGPAGIFAALELLKSEKKLRVLILEKGKDIDQRRCPSKEKKISCTFCRECNLLSGWGGAGAFSDGKLSLSPYVDGIYIHYGAPENTFGDNAEQISMLEKLASKNSLTLIPSRIRHIGTDR